MTGRMVSSSSVSPEFDMPARRRRAVIMPMSPWIASAGCRKNAGVPVLASVAAILLPMWPDLPMPVTTTLALQASTSCARPGEGFVEAMFERGNGGGLDFEDTAAAGDASGSKSVMATATAGRDGRQSTTYSRERLLL